MYIGIVSTVKYCTRALLLTMNKESLFDQECGERFTCKNLLLKHNITHTRNECNDDPTCKANFKGSVKKTKSTRCEECGKSLSSKKELKRHVKRIHKKIKPNSCDEYDRTVSQRYELIKHQNAVHRGMKPFECQSCCERFTKNPSLKRHFVKT